MFGKLAVLVAGMGVASCHENLRFRSCIDDGANYSAGDLTGDGREDFVHRNGDSLYFVPGSKEGVCAVPVKLAEMTNITSIRFYDGNGDGLTDIVVSHKDHWYSLSQRVSVLENLGNGKFRLSR